MQFLSQLRIGSRLAAGFGIVLLLSAISTSYALYHSNQTANATRAMRCQVGDDFLVIARVRLRLARIACRVHAGRTAQRIHAYARVIGQGRQAGQARSVARLGQCIFDKSVKRLFRLRHVEFALRVDGKTNGREQLVEFFELALVVRCENDALCHESRLF